MSRLVSIFAALILSVAAAAPMAQDRSAQIQTSSGVINAAPPAAAPAAADALGPEFEVATIRPANRDDGRRWYGTRLDSSGRFTASAVSLNTLVWQAYVDGPGKGKVAGGPKWASSDAFDINAKIDESYLDGWDKLSVAEQMDRMRPMLRRLLADRFQLKITVEMQPTPVYVLVQAKGGAKVKEVPAPDLGEGDRSEAMAKFMAQNPGKPIPGGIMCSGDACIANSVQMSHAVGQIGANARADRMVIDGTGLKGYYDFKVAMPRSNDDQAMEEVEDDLGLKFEPRTVPMKTYVIVSAEKPSVDGAEVTQ